MSQAAERDVTDAAAIAVAHWEGSEAYKQRLREVGLVPVEAGQNGLGRAAGLLLTGGPDIDPALYNERPHPKTLRPDRERDDFELKLLGEALAQDLPVLAICRGHQLLNVRLGGSLLQHVESGEHASREDEAHSSRWHRLTLTPGSRLDAIVGLGSLLVNSRHHQAVTAERLAPGLRVAALSGDGLVEAVESEAHTWVIGVQWHPEREESEVAEWERASRGLFGAFAAACGLEQNQDWKIDNDRRQHA